MFNKNGKTALSIPLCGYPHVKVSIRDLGQFSTTASIFQQYNYFRKIWRKMSLSLSTFLVLPQISLVKYYETIEILLQIF